jgi:hypothetical protein
MRFVLAVLAGLVATMAATVTASGQAQTVRLCVMTGTICAPITASNPLPISGGGGGGGGAVFGPTAAGSPAANPPVLMGGTVDGTAAGNVGVLKVSGGLAFINCANCSGSGASAADAAAFVAGTSLFAPSGGFFQTTATTSPLTTGQQGLVQMTAQRAFFVNLRNASGAELGVAAAPVQVSLANTAANATALKVDGSAVTQPTSLATLPALVAGSAIIGKVGIDQTTPGTTNLVSIGTTGTVNPTTASTWGILPLNSATSGQLARLVMGAVTNAAPTYVAAQSSPLSIDTGGGLRVSPAAPALWGIGTSTQNSASIANGALILGQFNTTPTTITSGNMSPLQMDNAGNLLVNIKAGASSGAVAQGSTTSGQTGGLTQAAVTTGAPTYTTATTNPLSMDTSGSLRVNVTSATGLAQGSTTSGQSGSMVMGAVTTAAPTYTTAQTSPLSIDVGGALRTRDAASSATGAAPSASAIYAGVNSSGTLRGQIQCDSTAVYDASTSGSTQLVALTSGQTIYVCGYAITTGGTATNVKLVYGTGTNCATSPSNMTAAYQLSANSGIVDRGDFYTGLKTAAANALCVNASAANAVQATVYYTKF